MPQYVVKLKDPDGDRHVLNVWADDYHAAAVAATGIARKLIGNKALEVLSTTSMKPGDKRPSGVK